MLVTLCPMQPSTKASQPTKKPRAIDRRLMLIEATALLEMFCEAGEEDRYNERDLLLYLNRIQRQAARALMLLSN